MFVTENYKNRTQQALCKLADQVEKAEQQSFGDKKLKSLPHDEHQLSTQIRTYAHSITVDDRVEESVGKFTTIALHVRNITNELGSLTEYHSTETLSNKIEKLYLNVLTELGSETRSTNLSNSVKSAESNNLMNTLNIGSETPIMRGATKHTISAGIFTAIGFFLANYNLANLAAGENGNPSDYPHLEAFSSDPTPIVFFLAIASALLIRMDHGQKKYNAALIAASIIGDNTVEVLGIEHNLIEPIAY